ncbi:MAG: hypothetical protein K940chlam2_01654, partial [Chlamydiae bacterium]|nr:hypothetical protein [Chlamydiota bacterium]
FEELPKLIGDISNQVFHSGIMIGMIVIVVKRNIAPRREKCRKFGIFRGNVVLGYQASIEDGRRGTFSVDPVSGYPPRLCKKAGQGNVSVLRC